MGADETQSIVAVIDGDWFTAEKDHPNYPEIKAALADRLLHADPSVQSHTDADIRDLFDLSFKIGQKFDTLSERLRVSGGRLFFDGDEIHGSIVEAILRLHNQREEDWKPLVRFLDKIKTNPNEHSQKYLYDWLTGNEFTIADDGDIIAYKSLNHDFTSVTAGPAIVNGEYVKGHVPNNPGNVVEMPRGDVAFDPQQTCSAGLHAATYQFAESFSRGPVVKLKINPRDVVSVPVDANGDKMRVCRYVVVEQVREALQTVVDPQRYVSKDPDFVDWEDEEDEDEFEEDQEVEAFIEEAESLVQRMKRRFGIQ
jgi:hypothetical protein